MQEEQKTLKQYCREAKKRLKQGFWRKYRENLDLELARAEKAGISASKVKEFYSQKVGNDIKHIRDENEEFYNKVRKILEEEGEVPNAIGRLTDRDVFSKLSYEEQQRYTLSLSEKYLKAVERFRREKELGYRA